jgi:hypothetical protein
MFLPNDLQRWPAVPSGFNPEEIGFLLNVNLPSATAKALNAIFTMLLAAFTILTTPSPLAASGVVGPTVSDGATVLGGHADSSATAPASPPSGTRSSAHRCRSHYKTSSQKYQKV